MIEKLEDYKIYNIEMAVSSGKGVYLGKYPNSNLHGIVTRDSKDPNILIVYSFSSFCFEENILKVKSPSRKKLTPFCKEYLEEILFKNRI